MTIVATAEIEGVGNLSWSKKIPSPPPKKDKRKWEEESWKLRLHTDKEGNVVIPRMCFKLALEAVAKYRSDTVPGKGKATYTKHFRSGVLPGDEDPKIGVHIDDVDHEWLSLPSTGVTGGGTRVDKCMPLIHSWACTVSFYVVDSTITRDRFEDYLKDAGMLIGVGRFRPQNSGFYGRFRLKSLKWEEYGG